MNIRIVMRTEPKVLYRTVQYEFAYCYTPNNIYIYNKYTHYTFILDAINHD